MYETTVILCKKILETIINLQNQVSYTLNLEHVYTLGPSNVSKLMNIKVQGD